MALECMCRAHIHLEKWDIAKKLLAKLETMYTSSGNEVTAILLRVQLAELADKAMPPLDILFGITVKHPDSPDAWYHLGMRCLEEDEIQQCINALFKVLYCLFMFILKINILFPFCLLKFIVLYSVQTLI